MKTATLTILASLLLFSHVHATVFEFKIINSNDSKTQYKGWTHVSTFNGTSVFKKPDSKTIINITNKDNALQLEEMANTINYKKAKLKHLKNQPIVSNEDTDVRAKHIRIRDITTLTVVIESMSEAYMRLLIESSTKE